MIYVCSDIHGELNNLITLLEKVNFSEKDKLYIVGDAIDRGSNSIGLINYIKSKNNIELLQGNHEEMLISTYIKQDYMMKRIWLNNGGLATQEQLRRLNREERIDIINYIETRPLIKVINNFVLAHAGIIIPSNLEKNYSLERILKNQPNNMLWLEDFYMKPALSKHTVIFGHTRTSFLRKTYNEPVLNKEQIWFDPVYKDKIGLDCGSSFSTGRLGLLRLEDMKEFYI